MTVADSVVERIVVVIPARNEEQRIASCLDAVNRARLVLRHHAPHVEVEVVVVADLCTDRTVEVAMGAGVVVVPSSAGRVGAARSAGVAAGLGGSIDREPARTWIACTDADSTVPADWLLTALEAAERGVGLLLGTVRLDPAEVSPEAYERWLMRHDLGDGHRHVHGANLGVRGDVYLAAGGFPPVAVHEDVLFAAHVRLLGVSVESTGRSPVVTSARLSGRTPDGLAGYLRALQVETA